MTKICFPEGERSLLFRVNSHSRYLLTELQLNFMELAETLGVAEVRWLGVERKVRLAESVGQFELDP